MDFYYFIEWLNCGYSNGQILSAAITLINSSCCRWYKEEVVSINCYLIHLKSAKKYNKIEKELAKHINILYTKRAVT